MKKVLTHPIFAVAYAILLWAFLYIFILPENLSMFTLQPLMVESLVERGTFDLLGSLTEQFQPVYQYKIDVVDYASGLFPAKAPGLAVLAGIPYFFVKHFSTFYSNYTVTTTAVTFFSVTLLTAILGALMYRLIYGETKKVGIALLLSLGTIFGTPIFAYSGVLYHDLPATFFLFLGFFLAFRTSTYKYITLTTIASALSLAAAVSLSYLAVIPGIIIAIYFLTKNKHRDNITFILVGLLGTLPLLYHNFHYFGAPTTIPHTANLESGAHLLDVLPTSSFQNALQKVHFYLIDPNNAFWAYSPIALLGLIGLLLFPMKYRRESVITLALFFGLLIYLSKIETVGHCMFGPRYFIFILPFLVFGLLGYFKRYKNHTLLYWVVTPVLLLSIFINYLGTTQTVMQCNLDTNTWLAALQKIL